MYIEIIVTALIVFAAAFIFYKNIKRKASGRCDCGSCSSHCPNYKEKNNLK